jgi:hypothetical protein
MKTLHGPTRYTSGPVTHNTSRDPAAISTRRQVGPARPSLMRTVSLPRCPTGQGLSHGVCVWRVGPGGRIRRLHEIRRGRRHVQREARSGHWGSGPYKRSRQCPVAILCQTQLHPRPSWILCMPAAGKKRTPLGASPARRVGLATPSTFGHQGGR